MFGLLIQLRILHFWVYCFIVHSVVFVQRLRDFFEFVAVVLPSLNYRLEVAILLIKDLSLHLRIITSSSASSFLFLLLFHLHLSLYILQDTFDLFGLRYLLGWLLQLVCVLVFLLVACLLLASRIQIIYVEVLLQVIII
jgi:hypothetical protein